MTNLKKKIEAILFYKGEPINIFELSVILSSDKSDIEVALSEIETDFREKGITLLRVGETAGFVTSSDCSDLIESILKEDLQKDIGTAGAETLAIILYKKSATRSEIDYIRGVNSSYILRHLLIRGLVEKSSNEKDKRTYIYKPSPTLLSFLGVRKLEELPDFYKVEKELTDFENDNKE